MNKPIRVGITGGIGSGKTTVSKIFGLLGVPVYNSDLRAHDLMNSDGTIIEQIQKLFGIEAITSEGIPNRVFISKIVFHNQELLAKLNAIIHPAVAEDFSAWCEQYQDKPYILKEAALLIETESYRQLDYLIVVSSPEALRIRRVLKRDLHRTEEDLVAILSRQASEKERRAKADYIIENDETSSVIVQVLSIDQRIRQS